MDNLEIKTFIIFEKNYKDSHKIFTLFSERNGVFDVVGYGVRSYKNRISKLGTPMNCFLRLKKNKSGILFIDDFKIENDYRSFGYDLLWEIIYFFRFLKVIEFENQEENQFVYNMLYKMLDICKHENISFFRVLSTSFILKTLVYLNIIYFSDKCISCGKKNDVIFLGSDGSIYCNDCKKNNFYKISKVDYYKIIELIYSKFEDIIIDEREINYFLIDKMLKPKLGKSINEFRPTKNPFSDKS